MHVSKESSNRCKCTLVINSMFVHFQLNVSQFGESGSWSYWMCMCSLVMTNSAVVLVFIESFFFYLMCSRCKFYVPSLNNFLKSCLVVEGLYSFHASLYHVTNFVKLCLRMPGLCCKINRRLHVYFTLCDDTNKGASKQISPIGYFLLEHVIRF